MSEAEHIAVTNFRTYLRIKTVQPKPDYESCTAFLKQMGQELDLLVKVFECAPGKPIVILTWTGQDTSLPSILLNSHTDVVPVFEESWNWDPFGADKVKDENGKYRIYARGTQDMKIVGLLYLEAIRELKKEGYKPLRTIHLSFVPDEEIGGIDGMQKFVRTKEFRELNIGLSLDEGIANPSNAYKVFYGERTAWKVKLRATGNTGHGSQFIENLATDKLLRVIKRFNDFREDQFNTLKGDANKKLGEVTTLNLNMIGGGVQINVVPKVVEATFDIRIATNVNLEEFQKKLEGFAKEEGVEFLFEQYFGGAPNTSVHPDYPWWKAITKACSKFGVEIEPEVFPAATDSRFLREINVPAYGVSPLKNLPILLHDHNEYVLEDTVLEGLKFYKILIPLVANEPTF